MAWISTIPDASADGRAAELYANAKARAGIIPNIARIQSLRASTALLGFELYCQVMDGEGGLSRRERVLIATVVSKLNGCLY